MRITSLFRTRPSFYLLDGGEHGQTMQHFSKAIFRNDNINLKFAELKINEERWGVKYIDTLEQTLKEISPDIKRGDFIALPALALATLRQLEQCVRNILGLNVELTTQNLKSNKNILLQMLQKIYQNQAKYEKDIESIDPNAQQFGFLAGVINEINKLTAKGANFYIPTGHPIDYAIRITADQRGCKDELYRYIATGKDEDGKVRKVVQDMKESGYYNLNLLTLANAHIVNVGNLDNQEYIYSAFDSLANDSERGVYNFYPIRNKSDKLLGFSFRDRSSLEYDINEYGGKREIGELLKFVGLNIRDVIADSMEYRILKQLIKENHSRTLAPDKLYRISDIYDESVIRERKLDCLGSFVNRDGNFVFDVNQNGEVLFQKCNIEGSSRPSVVSMWGSCFSSIMAAKRDFSK